MSGQEKLTRLIRRCEVALGTVVDDDDGIAGEVGDHCASVEPEAKRSAHVEDDVAGTASE